MLAYKLFGSGLNTLNVGAIVQDVATGIVAAGTTQGTATALTAALNGLGTVASGTGVILYAGSAGDCQIVYNGGANSVNVYPPVGSNINQLSVNIPNSLAINTANEYWFLSTAQIVAFINGGAIVVYSTLDPSNKDSHITLSNGNLTATSPSGTATGFGAAVSTAALESTGKFLAEYTINNKKNASELRIGIVKSGFNPTGQYVGQDTLSFGWIDNGQFVTNAVTLLSSPASYTTGDVISILVDLGSSTISFLKNGSSAGGTYSSLPATSFRPAVSLDDSVAAGTNQVTANYGSSPFTYPQSGYSGWSK